MIHLGYQIYSKFVFDTSIRTETYLEGVLMKWDNESH